MILAAGRGKRMRPLTDETPKPLLEVWGRPMIEWQILGLKAAGIKDFVINTAHLSRCFPEVLGNGSRLGVKIKYSIEGLTYEESLETRGGIAKALDLLTNPEDSAEPFIVVSGDIITNYDYSLLVRRGEEMKKEASLGHFVLVENPSFNPGGDMCLRNGKISQLPKEKTYGNMGVYKPRLFQNVAPVFAPLFPWIFKFAEKQQITGEVSDCEWYNVGTPDALEELNKKDKPRWAKKLESK